MLFWLICLICFPSLNFPLTTKEMRDPVQILVSDSHPRDTNIYLRWKVADLLKTFAGLSRKNIFAFPGVEVGRIFSATE